jgi:CHASE3 domain sensor protein
MDTFGVLLALVAVFFAVLGVLLLLAILAILYLVREIHREIVRENRQRREDVSVTLDALNAIVDASETTASTVQDAAAEDAADD